MSRPVLSLNITEDRLVARISAALERERAGRPPRVRQAEPDFVILNGRRYVAANDIAREQAERAFAKAKRGRG